MTTFLEFVTDEYNSSKVLPRYYPDIQSYIPSFIDQGNHLSWLESLRKQDLNMHQVEEIAALYLQHLSKQSDQIPPILVSIMRNYNVEIPVIEGILTPEFWRDRTLPSLAA